MSIGDLVSVLSTFSLLFCFHILIQAARSRGDANHRKCKDVLLLVPQSFMLNVAM